MDRRRTVALILGLVLCLTLLGRWLVRFDEAAQPADSLASSSAVVQMSRDDSEPAQILERESNQQIATARSSKSPPAAIASSRTGAIAGYLAAQDGITPVVGEVRLANLDDNITLSNYTDSAGEFSFEQLAAGRYQLIGRGGGMNGVRELELGNEERLERIVVAMSPGHSIRGVVSGLRPEERAEAHLYLVAEGSRSGIIHMVSVDDQGRYVFDGIASGTVRIQASAGVRGAVTKLVRMPADSDLTVDIQFKPGARLSGRVTAGGKPLAGAMLRPHATSVEEKNDLFLPPAVTATNGEYSYEEVPSGTYVFAIESFVSSTVRVSGDTVFDIDVPEVQLSGHVFEEGSQVPIVGARITARGTQPDSQSNRQGDTSNNLGQFSLRGLQPGEVELTAYKAGYELHRAPLAYGSPIADMTIYLRPAQGVEIKVREADTNDAIDTILVMELGKGSPGIAMQLQADGRGVSYIPSGLAGSSLRISAAGYFPIDVTDWNGQRLDLSLQREQ